MGYNKQPQMQFSWDFRKEYLQFPSRPTLFPKASIQTLSVLFINWRCFIRSLGKSYHHAARRTQVVVSIDGKNYRIKQAYYDKNDLCMHIEPDMTGPLNEPDFNLQWKKMYGEKVAWEVPFPEEGLPIEPRKEKKSVPK